MHRPRLIGYLSLLRSSLTSSGLRMNLGDLHRTRQRSQTHISHHGIKSNGTRAAQERKLGQIDDIKRDWTEFNIGEGDDLETGWRTSRNKVPVGVFEADASLLQFVSILQFGHILSIDRRLGHGLLEEDRHGQTNEKEETPLLESDLSVSTASWTNYHHNSGGLDVWMKTSKSVVSWVQCAEGSQRVCCRLPASTSAAVGYDCPFTLTIISQSGPRAGQHQINKWRLGDSRLSMGSMLHSSGCQETRGAVVKPDRAEHRLISYQGLRSLVIREFEQRSCDRCITVWHKDEAHLYSMREWNCVQDHLWSYGIMMWQHSLFLEWVSSNMNNQRLLLQ